MRLIGSVLQKALIIFSTNTQSSVLPPLRLSLVGCSVVALDLPHLLLKPMYMSPPSTCLPHPEMTSSERSVKLKSHPQIILLCRSLSFEGREIDSPITQKSGRKSNRRVYIPSCEKIPVIGARSQSKRSFPIL